jgi:integrase/Fe-S cluster biosynthesis and repair protein YggX
MDDFEEQEVLEILSELENSEIINKISKEEYIYFPNKKTERQTSSRLHTLNIEKRKDLTDINTLFSKNEEQEAYENATPKTKRRIVKYYTILKIASQFDNRCIDAFLKQFSKEHPEYKISPSTFYRIRQKYAQYGIRGLIPKYVSGAKSAVLQEMYDEFKNLYLKPNAPSVNECVRQLAKTHDEMSVPSAQCFRRLLHKEFTPKLVAQMREKSYRLPDLNFSQEDKLKIDEISNKSYENFIDGAKEYLKYLAKLRRTQDIQVKINAIRSHIIPFFKNYKFIEITQDVVFSFQNKKISEGYSRKYLIIFSKELEIIIKKYSDKNKFNLNFSTPQKYKEHPILTKDEINKIIEKYSQQLWILCLGITPMELYNLNYSDINYDEQTVLIRSLKYTIYNHHHKENLDRILYIPDILFNKIPKHQKGQVFLKVNVPNYDTLTNTHVYLSVKHNIPLNVISKNIGYTCCDDFLNRFDFALSHDFTHKINIFDSI